MTAAVFAKTKVISFPNVVPPTLFRDILILINLNICYYFYCTNLYAD
jgi:hypothetical protein